MNRNYLKLRITGPEATGKSSLAQKLSTYYHEPWVPEAAREYLEELDRPYIQSDLDVMLQRQMELEQRAIWQAKRLVICDTGPEVFWVWSKFKYNSVSPFIQEALNVMRYEQTFLMDIDLPWTPDPLREHPELDDRKTIFNLYISLLKDRGIDFEVISGKGVERFQNAIKCLPFNS